MYSYNAIYLFPMRSHGLVVSVVLWVFEKKIDDISYSYIYEKSVNVKVYNQIIIISLFNSKIANINTNFYIMYRVF